MTKPDRRIRVRVTTCCINRCEHRVSRANAFQLCTQHLVEIWEFVGEDIIDREARLNLALQDMRTYENHQPTPDELEARRHAHKAAARKASATNGQLYVLDTGLSNYVKIGWTSRDVWQRINEYPPTFDVITYCAGSRADERDLHRSLKLFRVEGIGGKEWYEARGEVVRSINEIIAQQNIKHAQALRATSANRSPQLIPKFTTLEDWRRRNTRAPKESPKYIRGSGS